MGYPFQGSAQLTNKWTPSDLAPPIHHCLHSVSSLTWHAKAVVYLAAWPIPSARYPIGKSCESGTFHQQPVQTISLHGAHWRSILGVGWFEAVIWQNVPRVKDFGDKQWSGERTCTCSWQQEACWLARVNVPNNKVCSCARSIKGSWCLE